MKNKLSHIILFWCLCPFALFAWDWWPLTIDFNESKSKADSLLMRTDSLLYGVELLGVTSTGKFTPFLLQSNRNGNISALPHSGNLSVGVSKPSAHLRRWWDYDFAVQLTGRMADTKKMDAPFINQLYAHARLLFVDITAGIAPYHVGPQDDNLSSGGLLFSQNAAPMPRISVGIDQYTAFPGLYGYLEVRGGLTHAWFNDNQYVNKSYLHHAFAGVRVGGKLPVRIGYEFHHAAQWGGYSPVWGDLGNDLHAFINAVLARSGGSMANDQINAQGNHIGSQILTAEFNYDGWHARAYWQTLFEDGPILFMTNTMNLPDGLWGIHLSQDKWPFISGFTYEFLNTTDQSGPYHDRDGFIYGGSDSYFTNGIYRNGWNYFLRTIGNPYITSPIYDAILQGGATKQDDLQSTNNRVRVHFVGIEGDIYGYQYRLIGSHAKNYGTYTIPQAYTQTSLLVEVTKHVPQAWGLDFSLGLATDVNKPMYTPQVENNFSSFGVMLRVSKRGLITNW